MNLRTQMEKMLKLEEEAQKLDFKSTQLFLARDIVLDERVRLQCRINMCGNYNKNLMCPPHLPPVNEVRATIRQYTFALLVILQISNILEKELRDQFHRQALLLSEKLISLEKQAFAFGFPLALGLSAGECKLCDTCIVLNQTGTDCRFPQSARPSMEGMGINVLATASKLGASLDFIPGELKMAGLLLIE